MHMQLFGFNCDTKKIRLHYEGKEDEIIKNFNLNIEQLIKQDFSVEKLIVSLKNYNLIDCLDKKYCIRPEAINKAIVIMQHCKDEWGYRLITAPNKLQTEVRK